MTDRELMQMVLEELEELADVGYGSKTVLEALRERLAQPEPEPVAWKQDACCGEYEKCTRACTPRGFWLADQTRALAANQKPVAWHEPGAYGNVTTNKDWALANGWEPLYTAPPKREWVGLTDEEMRELEKQFNAERVRTSDEEYLVIYPADYWRWQRAIEAKLKEKNT